MRIYNSRWCSNTRTDMILLLFTIYQTFMDRENNFLFSLFLKGILHELFLEIMLIFPDANFTIYSIVGSSYELIFFSVFVRV